MIKVNLLPAAQKERRPKRKKAAPTKIEIPIGLILAAVAFVLVNVLGAYFVHGRLQAQADSIQQEILQVEQAIARLKLDIRKVEEAKKKKAQLQQKIDIIKNLKSGQTGPVRLMDSLAEAVPQHLWLMDMSENGSKIQMKGLALEDEQISAFMRALEASNVFHGVELSVVSEERRPGYPKPLRAFQITCNIRYLASER